jgi:hypothetical protein
MGARRFISKPFAFSVHFSGYPIGAKAEAWRAYTYMGASHSFYYYYLDLVGQLHRCLCCCRYGQLSQYITMKQKFIVQLAIKRNAAQIDKVAGQVGQYFTFDTTMVASYLNPKCEIFIVRTAVHVLTLLPPSACATTSQPAIDRPAWFSGTSTRRAWAEAPAAVWMVTATTSTRTNVVSSAVVPNTTLPRTEITSVSKWVPLQIIALISWIVWRTRRRVWMRFNSFQSINSS